MFDEVEAYGVKQIYVPVINEEIFGHSPSFWENSESPKFSDLKTGIFFNDNVTLEFSYNVNWVANLCVQESAISPTKTAQHEYV